MELNMLRELDWETWGIVYGIAFLTLLFFTT